MKTLSSVDLHFLVGEMHFLVGGRVDKIYHPRKEEALLQFFVPGKGKHLLRIIAGKALFLSESKEGQEEPSGFCMFLRRHFENARLLELQQVNSERIVKLTFDTKEGELHLYTELFGQGNLVISKDGMIINALQQKTWADREIKKGKEYVFPKKGFNAFTLDEKAFTKALDSDKDLVLRLAKEIGLGGTYAEEICLLADVDKKSKNLSSLELKKLFAAYEKILGRKLEPQVVETAGKVVDAIPFPLLSFKDKDLRPCQSFNEAMDILYQEGVGAEAFVSKHQAEIERIQSIISGQEKNVESLLAEAEQEHKKGGLIYEQYALISDILKQVNAARKTLSFDEMKKKLKGHKIVKEIDGKEKKVTIDLA
ncbi:NFACT family protein [Candidatus Woesearchaeota archaeon]|nr:NFACT family protein [Candidatus Woesearchaeota archaeon]